MNEDHIAPMTPLDQMLAQDSLQMLKAAVPYFPADAQRVFALYAKMMELSHTIAMFSGGPAELMMMSEESGTSQPLDILQQLRTYAGESQKEMIDQILFAFHALEILQMPQERMKDSTLEGIDPAKMALLQSLIQQGSKKNQNEMLAFLMSAAANSKKNGLQFSPGEMDMITKVLKKGKSSQEIAKMDRILSMMKMLRRG